MSSPSWKFLFDETVHVGAARELVSREVDVVHALDLERPIDDDRDVLEYARERGRIVVTRNYQDFAPLVEAYNRRGRSFPGVLFLPTSLPQGDAGEHVRRLEAWMERHEGTGNPIRDTFGWL